MAIDEDLPDNPLVRLEHTFTGYMASLHSRKGNFIGRQIINRGAVDELIVNDVYNKLIENPFDVDPSADITADVIFVAFEKFVKIAWQDQMGPIISRKHLDALQERNSKRVVGEFADFVRFLFGDVAPQNKRAFTALIKLLADLLDGCALSPFAFLQGRLNGFKVTLHGFDLTRIGDTFAIVGSLLSPVL